VIPDVFVRARPVLVAVAILAAILVVGLLTVGDYGITFDEPIRARSGDAWWHFIATRDRSYLPEGWFANLGAWFDMLGSAMVRAYRALGGHDEYLPRHVLVLLCGLAGMAGTFALARRVLSPWLAVVALVLLALAPRYYGPCFNNPKDIPFAATLVWAIYGIVRLLQEPTRRSALRVSGRSARRPKSSVASCSPLPSSPGSWPPRLRGQSSGCVGPGFSSKLFQLLRRARRTSTSARSIEPSTPRLPTRPCGSRLPFHCRRSFWRSSERPASRCFRA
jgi:hypothetical protein